MKLVELKCPNCGGELKVNPEREFVTCGYCHTEFKVDDEISRSETHHIITDEAKIKEVEYIKEVKLKELEMKEKEKQRESLILKIQIIVSVILGLIAVISFIIEDFSFIGSFACFALMIMWSIIIGSKDK